MFNTWFIRLGFRAHSMEWTWLKLDYYTVAHQSSLKLLLPWKSVVAVWWWCYATQTNDFRGELTDVSAEFYALPLSTVDTNCTRLHGTYHRNIFSCVWSLFNFLKRYRIYFGYSDPVYIVSYSNYTHLLGWLRVVSAKRKFTVLCRAQIQKRYSWDPIQWLAFRNQRMCRPTQRC